MTDSTKINIVCY